MSARIHYPSPVGWLTAEEENGALTALKFGRHGTEMAETELLCALRTALDRYFSGARETFDLPLRLQGTDFQQTVWRALRRVPYGETRSYGWLCGQIGRPDAFRAVGNAVGRNPLVILLPCHRIIRADGQMGGFTGGGEKKRFLLELEHGQS